MNLEITEEERALLQSLLGQNIQELRSIQGIESLPVSVRTALASSITSTRAFFDRVRDLT